MMGFLERWQDMARPNWVRALAVFACCVLGCWIFLEVMGDRYAVKSWLAWDILSLWGWVFVLTASFLSLGALLLTRVLKLTDEPPLRALLFSAALGLPAFCWCMYAAGVLGLFGPWLTVVLPTLCVAIGGRAALGILSGSIDSCRNTGRPSGVLSWLAIAWGVACIGLLYLQAMTPDAINYDAGWYHLPIAQDYAREGRLVPFYGDHNRAFPHLASLIHTFGFCAPDLLPQLKWMLALHIEFSIVLWKLFGALVGAQWMINARGPRGLWAGFFLFPSLFVYDQNIGGSADHFLGFFAVPAFLATALSLKRFDLRYCALAGAILGGAILTKYQAVYAITASVALLAVRWLYCGVVWLRARSGKGTPIVDGRQLLLAAAVVLGTTLLVSSPHFIKNLVYFHNPLHPFAQDLFGSSPSHEKSAFWFKVAYANDEYLPPKDFFERLVNGVKLFFTFSFEPHYSFTKNFPSMGSLFTLLLPCALFVRSPGRIALGAAAAFVGIMTWAFTYIGDRYLQGQITVPIAVTLALLVRVWELGTTARFGLSALVALQLVWGTDAMFYSGHPRLHSAVQLIRTGYEGKHKPGRRYRYRALERKVTGKTPEDAVLMVRNYRELLGIDRTTLSDVEAWQNIFFYDELSGPRDLYEMYKQQGVTHILYPKNNRPQGTKQASVVFADFIHRYTDKAKKIGSLHLVEMPKKPPPKDPELFNVLVIGQTGYPLGWYDVEQLNLYHRVPKKLWDKPTPQKPYAIKMNPNKLRQELGHTRAVVVSHGHKAPPALTETLKKDYVLAERFKYFKLYLRKKVPR